MSAVQQMVDAEEQMRVEGMYVQMYVQIWPRDLLKRVLKE